MSCEFHLLPCSGGALETFGGGGWGVRTGEKTCIMMDGCKKGKKSSAEERRECSRS